MLLMEKQLRPLSILSLVPSCNTSFQQPTITLRWPSPALRTYRIRALSVSQDEIPSNAVRRMDPRFRGGFSLGIDLGGSRTGVAISKGYAPRPLTVLKLRGEKLELRLLEIAEQEEADEFVIGLPRSSDGKETPQSNVVRSIAGRFAVRAADKGWRVYLQDEHGTSMEGLSLMINAGIKRPVRQKGRIDEYAAIVILERYFNESGKGAELVLPKQLDLQEKIRRGPLKDADVFPGELGLRKPTHSSRN